eukprot:TRINITY_DN9435_c0_g1_i1.p1 TRINITY_DN9435_c0_g1~~TRINITY_DN9435_c0_g1_i1.p1  ORF type:complete len:331 (+),score=54.78 TRINITY_DN9435_c0_g1_i1:70-1062(+)
MTIDFAMSESTSTLGGTMRSTGSLAQNSVRWCNNVYVSRCPYDQRDCNGEEGGCKFLHIDKFMAKASSGLLEECRAGGLPNLMEKNMKALAKEMIKSVNAKVAAAKERVQCLLGMASPYEEVVASLQEIGWSIDSPIPANETETQETIKAILLVIAHTLHYDCTGASQVMFDTVAYILGVSGTHVISPPPSPPTPICPVATRMPTPPIAIPQTPGQNTSQSSAFDSAASEDALESGSALDEDAKASDMLGVAPLVSATSTHSAWMTCSRGGSRTEDGDNLEDSIRTNCPYASFSSVDLERFQSKHIATPECNERRASVAYDLPLYSFGCF